MRLWSPEQTVTVPLEAKSLEFNFQSSFSKDTTNPGTINFNIKAGVGEESSPTRI